MLAPMTRIATLWGFTCLLASLSAQQSLKGLEQRFRQEAQQLATTSSNRAQQDQLLGRHVNELRAFLKDTAKGDDRWNGRLWLADLELVRGNREDAKKVLQGMDADQAPALA